MTEVPTVVFGGVDQDEIPAMVSVFGDVPLAFVEMKAEALVLSDQEAAELYRYLLNDYINPNTYPSLLGLLARIERKVKA